MGQNFEKWHFLAIFEIRMKIQQTPFILKQVYYRHLPNKALQHLSQNIKLCFTKKKHPATKALQHVLQYVKLCPLMLWWNHTGHDHSRCNLRKWWGCKLLQNRYQEGLSCLFYVVLFFTKVYSFWKCIILSHLSSHLIVLYETPVYYVSDCFTTIDTTYD